MKGKFEFNLAAHALLKQANDRARPAAQDPALERFASDPHLLAPRLLMSPSGKAWISFSARRRTLSMFSRRDNNV